MIKPILRILAVLLVKHLQRRYKALSLSNQDYSGTFISKLILIQHILYFLKTQFSAWGYFHPTGAWYKKDEEFFRKLFPVKDFKELPTVVHHNPEAIKYYHHKIGTLTKGTFTEYHVEIKEQLLNWRHWN